MCPNWACVIVAYRNNIKCDVWHSIWRTWGHPQWFMQLFLHLMLWKHLAHAFAACTTWKSQLTWFLAFLWHSWKWACMPATVMLSLSTCCSYICFSLHTICMWFVQLLCATPTVSSCWCRIVHIRMQSALQQLEAYHLLVALACGYEHD